MSEVLKLKKIISTLKKIFSPVGDFIITVAKKVHAHPFLEFLIFSSVMYFTVDILCRRSFVEPFTFIFRSPFIFLFNFLIVAFTMSLSLISYHRYFFYMVNAALWLTISIANYVIQSMRTNPFSAIDLKVVLSAYDVIPKYIGWGGVILILAAFVAAGVLLVLLWRRCPKPSKFNRKKSLLRSGIIALLLSSFVFYTAYTEYIPAELESAIKAYDDYGFPYCFFRSFVHRGVVSPDEYSKEAVDELLEKLGEDEPGNTASNSPNVIFLQLESFFDVNKVIDLEISENPIPVFTSLKQSCPTGKFSVNAVGGGTANTEFEVLCGMNLAHFGLLECPYSTILNEVPCQSLASVMTDAGFTSHAIHNHIATFYTRNLVYPNIGFNTFTPIEYMKDYERNILGWCKDDVLIKQITNSLESTDGKDFVFTVSVQPHGKYPDYETIGEDGIKVLSYPYDDKIYEVEYFINQIRETDAMVGELIALLEDYPEDVVLVVYGDHLPTLGLKNENMFDGDIYSTEYVVWSNCGFKCEGGDVQAFQLSAKILDALGITGGEMFRIHNKLADDEKYYTYMQLMEYDMLKGENYALGDDLPTPTEIMLGTETISVSALQIYEDIMFVSGENFTKDSYDMRCETVYINDTLLLAKDVEVDVSNIVYVAQLCDGSTLLSQTNSLVYDPENMIVTDVPSIFPTETDKTDETEASEVTGTDIPEIPSESVPSVTEE